MTVMRGMCVLVLALLSSAAFGAPCTMVLAPYAVHMSLQSSPTRSGWLRLHYENAFFAYAPQFGAPVVSRQEGQDETVFTITQPVTDVADPGKPSSPPASTFCHAEDVELGPVGTGIHFVLLGYPLTVPGAEGQPNYSGGGGGFIVDAKGVVQCSTTRSFALRSLPVAGSPLTVSSTIMIIGGYLGTEVSRRGSTFVVTDTTSTEVPAKYVYYCLTTNAALGPLPTGRYSVEWKVNDFGLPRPEATGLFSFGVGAVARHHAAR